MSKSKGSPRKFSEKIALLNKKEAESNEEFERIIKEVEKSTRVPPVLSYSPTLNEAHLPRPGNSYGGQQQQQQSPMWTQSSSNQPIGNGHHQLNLEQPTIDTTTGGLHYIEEHQLPMLDSFQQLGSPHMVQQQVTTTDYIPHETLATSQHQIVPNIKIFPIDDQPQNQQYQQQQQSQQQQVSSHQNPLHQPHQHPNHHQHQVSSNYPLISGARSLPDIASLRVSGSFSSIGSAYSHQRLPQTTTADDSNNQYQYQSTYDANSNLVKTTPTTQYLPTLEHQVWQQQQQHQQQGYYPVQPLADDNFNSAQFQMIPIARASSTQACWPTATTSTTSTVANGHELGNGLGANLEAPPPTSSSLSRSADGCYGSYMDQQHHQTAEPQMACYGLTDTSQLGHHQTTSMATQSMVHGHRFRSSSYNSLGQMQVGYQPSGAGGIQHPNLFAKSPPQFYG